MGEPKVNKEGEELIAEHDVLILEWLEFAREQPASPRKQELVNLSLRYLAKQYPDIAAESQEGQIVLADAERLKAALH